MTIICRQLYDPWDLGAPQPFQYASGCMPRCPGPAAAAPVDQSRSRLRCGGCDRVGAGVKAAQQALNDSRPAIVFWDLAGQLPDGNLMSSLWTISCASEFSLSTPCCAGFAKNGGQIPRGRRGHPRGMAAAMQRLPQSEHRRDGSAPRGTGCGTPGRGCIAWGTVRWPCGRQTRFLVPHIGAASISATPPEEGDEEAG